MMADFSSFRLRDGQSTLAALSIACVTYNAVVYLYSPLINIDYVFNTFIFVANLIFVSEVHTAHMVGCLTNLMW